MGDALNAGFRYLEVKCAGCNTHSTADLTILRRPRETPIGQLEQRMRCRPCSEMRGSPYKRGHLVRLRRTNITTAGRGMVSR
jgi:phage FluMu protein Com